MSLMMQFERYQSWTMSDIQNYVIPPIQLGQCHIFCDTSGNPTGYFSWAFMDPKVAQVVMTTPGTMRPHHWQCGPELWTVEFISVPGTIRQNIKSTKSWFPQDSKRVRAYDMKTVRGRYGRIL